MRCQITVRFSPPPSNWSMTQGCAVARLIEGIDHPHPFGCRPGRYLVQGAATRFAYEFPMGAAAMNAAEALQAARAAGIQVKIDGADLLLKASAPPPAGVLDELSRHKA